MGGTVGQRHSVFLGMSFAFGLVIEINGADQSGGKGGTAMKIASIGWKSGKWSDGTFLRLLARSAMANRGSWPIGLEI
jgi:hypothetical protein